MPKPIPAPILKVPQGATTVDFVCGLRKRGSNRYSLVTGQVIDGVPSLKVDEVSQPLEFAAEELRAEFQKLMEIIP